jgi:lysophospholipase L1-like esterase
VRARRRELLWRLACGAAGLAVGAGLAGGAGFVLVRRLYLERADLRLDPAGQDHHAAANRALPAAHRPRAVFFGDSRIAYWSPPPDLPGRTLVFRGIAGQSTAQLRLRFAEDVLALAPQEVVIQAGVNDLIAGQIAGRRDEAVARTVANLAALAEEAGARGIRVLLTTIVRPARPGLSHERLFVSVEALAADVALVNAALRTLALPSLRVLDLDALLAGDATALPEQYAADLVHFSEAAYAAINREIAAALAE